jgi:hypothetical protein
MILISSLGYLSSVLISRFQIHFNGCPFFRVHIRGGLNLCGLWSGQRPGVTCAKKAKSKG